MDEKLEKAFGVANYMATLSNQRRIILEEFKQQDKDVQVLAYKMLLEKFNNKYVSLNYNQKLVLKEFINSIDSTPKLKEFYNTKVNEIKNRWI